MNTKKIDALTGIRAVAAMMVFLYHNRKYYRSSLPSWLIQLLNEFHTGVSLFFVLSGFLIAYTYRDKPASGFKSYLVYILIRTARIFPVYWLLLSAKYIHEGFPSPKETFLTYSLLHGFSDRLNLNGITQAWSLTVEFSFYTFAPFIYWGVRKNITKTVMALVLLLGLTVSIGYYWYYINKNPDRFFYPWYFILNTSFPGRFFEFFSGVLLANYLINHQSSGNRRNIFFTSIGSLLSLLLIWALGFWEKDIYSHGTDTWIGLVIRNLLFPCSIVLLLYGLITEESYLKKVLSSKLFVLLGNASFCFYLIHISYVNQQIRGFVLLPDRNFVLLWLISILLYTLIEKPVYEKLKKFIKKLEQT